MKKHHVHEILSILYTIVLLLIPTTGGLVGVTASLLFLACAVVHTAQSILWYIKDKEARG